MGGRDTLVAGGRSCNGGACGRHGLNDVFDDQQIRQLSTVWWHASANVLVVLVELYNLFIRYQQGSAAIIPNGLLLSLVAFVVSRRSPPSVVQRMEGRRFGIPRPCRRSGLKRDYGLHMLWPRLSRSATT